jgi:hypothetical protein
MSPSAAWKGGDLEDVRRPTLKFVATKTADELDLKPCTESAQPEMRASPLAAKKSVAP